MRMRDVIICMIFLVLAVAAGLAAFNEWGQSDQPDFEYLDMVPLSDFGEPDAVSGCCEIVTYLGEPYVRMTGVGEVHVVNGSKVTDYTVGKAQLDLILLTGQSNSYYYSQPEYYDGPSPLPPGTGFYFGTEDVTETDYWKEDTALATWSSLEQSTFVDMTAPDGSARVACSYPAVLYDWWKETGHRALIASSGEGGHGIQSFYIDWGNGYRWTEAVLGAIKDRAEGLVDLNPVAVLWSHGGSNRSHTVEFYEEGLETVLGYFTDGTYGIAFPVMFSTLPKYPGWTSPINPAIAQQNVAAEDPRFIIASTLPLVLPDSVSGREDGTDYNHYNQRLYSLMGEAFARAMASHYGYEPVEQTLFYIAGLGEVDALPSEVVAYGSSGASLDLPVSWTGAGTEPGTYNVQGTVTVPFGYEAVYGLKAEATLVVADETPSNESE